jgi:hypothetical protein
MGSEKEQRVTGKITVLALALFCAGALPPAGLAAPGPVDAIAGMSSNAVIASGSIDERTYLHLAQSPRREKICRELATGNSDSAKEKSYRDCLKTRR